MNKMENTVMNGGEGVTLRGREDWQLTDAEIADLERTCSEEAAGRNERAHKTGCIPKYEVRVQRIELVSIEVGANSANEAKSKALNTLRNRPEASGEVLRSEFGHMTIERL